jgi:predicted transcriptional regulator
MRDRTASLLFREDPARVLLAVRRLERPSPEKVGEEWGISRREVVSILEDFRDQGLVESAGARAYSLTPMGDALAENFQDIDRKLRKWPGFRGKPGITGSGVPVERPER